ncbi:MAG: lysylphosphatidylglycerol synthase transmembrane domain-containing protein, partial [Anaerolineales bacterium]
SGRWLMLVRALGIRIGYFDAFRLVLAGLFASNFLPSTVGGDVTRIAGIIPRSSDKLAGAASVVADRLVSLVGMCFLIPFSLPILAAWASAGIPLGLAASGASTTPLGDRGRRVLARIRGVVDLWRQKPSAVAAALALSWLGLGCYLAAMSLLARGLGIPVTPIQVAGATTITYFLTLVPIAINGYGIREAAILAVYLPLGARPEQATALALVSRALAVFVTLPGAFWLAQIPAGSLSPTPRAEGGRK